MLPHNGKGGGGKKKERKQSERIGGGEREREREKQMLVCVVGLKNFYFLFVKFFYSSFWGEFFTCLKELEIKNQKSQM